MRSVSLLAVLLVVVPTAGRGQAAPHAIDIPPWFSNTFLDLREDVREAAQSGRRVMLYFGQEGCPYCEALMQTNFTQPKIVEKTRRNFVAVALDIWGDREVTWLDGKVMREKDLAKFLKVQFTPMLLFFDEKGAVVARLNGYYPPHRFEAALDYVGARMETKVSFQEYLRKSVGEAASEKLHNEPFFMKPPYDLHRTIGAKPLAVIFETPYCSGCDELHREGFRRSAVKDQLVKFNVVRFALSESAEIISPSGTKLAAAEWARELKIAYTPSIVFFDAGGREVFRIEAYLRPFHLAGSLEYVSSGAYATEPSFQRFLQAKAKRMRARGETVDLWK